MRISDWSSDVCSSDLEIVESAQNLIGGGGVVPYMQEQQVDIVSPKPLEAILNSAHHILAAIASGIGVARLDSEGIFGRKHKLIALFPRKLACKLLGSALGIIAGCIHEVAAAIPIGIEDRARFTLFSAPDFAKSHGSQRER